MNQYQIWRGIKRGKTGDLEPPYQIGSVNRGTTSFTDYAFIVTNTYIDCLLHYDVRAVYQNGGTTLYSEPTYCAATFGSLSLRKANNNAGKSLSIDRIRINSFPNPFNPSTVISYQLPAGTQYVVSLIVYDMRGKEVSKLANGTKEPGYYSVKFDGIKLGSGIYFARFTAQSMNGNEPFSQTMKIILVK